MCLCTYMCVPLETRDSIRVTGSYKLPGRCWDQNWGPLEEHQELLTTELPLQLFILFSHLLLHVSLDNSNHVWCILITATPHPLWTAPQPFYPPFSIQAPPCPDSCLFVLWPTELNWGCLCDHGFGPAWWTHQLVHNGKQWWSLF